MELLNKITLKAMECQPKKAPEAAQDLVVVYGTVRDTKLTTTNYGESFRLIGDFEAQRIADGKTFRAAALFLPRVIESLMVDAITRMRKDGNEDVALEFAVKIGIKPSNSNVGYEWTVTPLVNMQESDALAHLRDAVLKALPAPETATAKPEKAAKGKK